MLLLRETIKMVYIKPHPSITGLFFVKSKAKLKHHCSPAELLDAADIHNPIVKMCRKSLHILVKKSLIHMHGVSSQGARALGRMLLNKCQHFILQFC